MRSSATAMIADEPGGRLLPISFRSSSLKPLSRILPHTPPAPPPTTAETMMLGGKISPTTPPAIAPRFAHFLPLGSAVSSNFTFPSAVVDDHSRVDQIDGTVALGRLEILGCRSSAFLGAVRRDKQLHRARAHSPLLCLVGRAKPYWHKPAPARFR